MNTDKVRNSICEAAKNLQEACQLGLIGGSAIEQRIDLAFFAISKILNLIDEIPVPAEKTYDNFGHVELLMEARDLLVEAGVPLWKSSIGQDANALIQRIDQVTQELTSVNDERRGLEEGLQNSDSCRCIATTPT